MPDRVVTLLMAVGGLRDHIAIALREGECLGDQRAGRVDKELVAQFAQCCDRVKRDVRAEPRNRRRRVTAELLELVGIERARGALGSRRDLVARRRRSDRARTGQGLRHRAVMLEYRGLLARAEAGSLISL